MASSELRAEQARLLAAARDGSWSVGDQARFYQLSSESLRGVAASSGDPVWAADLEAWAADHDALAVDLARVSSLDRPLGGGL